MKHYLEWLGLFAVSGCLALMINSAAVAHPHASVQPSNLGLKAELRAAMCIATSHLNQRR
ncbi:MAG: hypothetical protein HC929_24415 [Leptolyngbyaceae cyanobacterium SM2_5_2]|nr:hypothetical protein [Leptolyngbyaceae cyanobacterium SM2_5_2]